MLLFVFKVAKRHFVVVQPLRHAIETRPLDAGIRETVAAFLKVCIQTRKIMRTHLHTLNHFEYVLKTLFLALRAFLPRD